MAQDGAHEGVEKLSTRSLTDVIKLARVDMVLELFGNLESKSTIIRALMRGWDGVPPVSSRMAYRYYALAMKVMAPKREASLAVKRREHLSRLKALAKSAKKAGDHKAAQEALDRIALMEGVTSPDGEAPIPDSSPTFVVALPDQAKPDGWARE